MTHGLFHWNRWASRLLIGKWSSLSPDYADAQSMGTRQQHAGDHARAKLIAIAFAAFVASGCGSASQEGDLDDIAISPDWLAPSIRDSIDRRGRFVLAEGSLHSREHSLIKLQASADSLIQWLRTAPQPWAAQMEFERGDLRQATRIEFPSLVRCGREYTMTSPYPDLDPALPNFFKNMAGSQVRFTACDERGEAIALTVPAYTDVTFPGGVPTIPSFGSGNSYLIGGLGTRTNTFISPEAAAYLVRRRTQDTIAAVPTAFGPLFILQEGLCPTWRVATAGAHALKARNGSAVYVRSEIYVSALGCVSYGPGTLLVTSDSQPDPDVVHAVFLDSVSAAPRDTSIVLRALPFTRFIVIE